MAKRSDNLRKAEAYADDVFQTLTVIAETANKAVADTRNALVLLESVFSSGEISKEEYEASKKRVVEMNKKLIKILNATGWPR